MEGRPLRPHRTERHRRQGRLRHAWHLHRPGIQHHINYLDYLDYQVWRYQQKLEKMGIADNTILIFCADNGTGGFGKHSPDCQKGTHVPLIIHAPGMTKRGNQDVLVNMADFLPTLANLTGAKLPADYEHNGESLVPFLFTGQPTHRNWIYAYSGEKQLIRGTHVTLLHLLGLDDNKLTYYHVGRYKQLGQFGGQEIQELIA